MSTENDFKPLNQPDSMNLVLSKQQSLETKTKEKRNPVYPIKKWISTYRSTTRTKIGRKALKFSTVLAFLPVAAGFLDFLRPQISSPRSYESFFQKTLPVFANFQPKLSYETFHYIARANLDLPLTHTNFVLGQPKFVATLNQFNSEKTFLNKKIETTNRSQNDFALGSFNGFSCEFCQISSERLAPFSQKVLFSSLNSATPLLDELPGYVQGLQSNSSNLVHNVPNSLITDKKLLQTDLLSQIEKPLPMDVKVFSSSILKKEGVKKSLVVPNDFLLNSNSQKPLRLVQKPKIEDFGTPLSLNQQLWAEHGDFYNNIEKLEKEFRNLFREKQISLGLTTVLEQGELENQKESSFVKDFLQKNSHIDDEFLINLVLRQLDKQRISTEATGFRLMSGYLYPDTTNQELFRFYKQNHVLNFFFGKRECFAKLFKFSSKSHFEKKITSLSQNHSFSVSTEIPFSANQYEFNIKALPSFVIQTQETRIKSQDNSKILYQGTGLVLDSNTAFDWIIRGRLRSWFHNYLSPLNPFNQNQKNFFGLYDSPLNLNEKTVETAFKERSFFFREFFMNLNRSFLVINRAQDNFPSRSAFFIPSNYPFPKFEKFGVNGVFEPESTENCFIRAVETSLTESENENSLNNLEKENVVTEHQFIPLIQQNQPYFKVSPLPQKSLFGAKPTEFQGYSPVFDLGLTAKSDYTFALNLVAEKESIRHYSSGQYRKMPSIFSKSLLKRGVSNWEPLTASSWLVLSQLSFALFIFQILKNLAENYGRELLSYLLDLVAALGFLDESLKQEIEILMGRREKGFRIITQSPKSFTDIVGVQQFLPELYEVIWYLRNSAREFSLSGSLPRGVLLTGPPGTGKTLLVQALAGEAHVPVIVLSGSSLIEPGEIASTKLELVFQEARQIAPCVVFIDEIDTLAPKRSGVVQNPMAHDEIVDFLTSFESFKPESTLENLEAEFQEEEAKREEKEKKSDQQKIEGVGTEASQQLSLLTQLLIELDGIRGRDGVLVVGATNRVDILDPALLRPGRFDKIIEVGLPNKQKRVEILQFYGDKLGYQEAIPWNYLGERTVGFSAADLATLMNESALKAILTEKETLHTLQTIEHGIDRLTSSENEKPTILKLKPNGTLSIASKFSLIRFAYYQAGKIVVSSVLKDHPKTVFATLWPRCPNIRSLEITTNLQTSIFEFARLCELNDRLVGCYAGKAAEFLFLEKFASHRSAHRSTLGLEDLLFGQTVAFSLLEKSLFYSKKTYTQQNIILPQNINELEFPEMTGKLEFYEELVDTIEYPPFEKALEEDTSSLTEKRTIYDDWEAQTFYFVPWWQRETSDALEFVEKNFHNWTRFYLENPERTERNVEWRPPDEFYHTDTALKNVKTDFTNLSKKNLELEPSETSSLQKERSSSDSLLKREGGSKPEVLTPNISNLKLDEESTVSGPENNEVQDLFKTESEQIASSKTQEVERYNPTESKPQNVNIPWRYQDKTQNWYPSQNVYIPWNDVSNLTRDYPVQSLILQSFNKALVILNENRELVDRIVIDLLCEEILRQHEIESVVQEFQKTSISNYNDETSPKNTVFGNEPLEKPKGFEILEFGWGEYSRKPRPHWIDFAQFSKQTT